MKIRLFLLLSGVFMFPFLLASGQSAKPIVIGQIDSFQSKILKEKRKIWVHVPKNYHKGDSQRYPVVYLLDGDDHFSSVVGMIERMSTLGNSLCPEMIVVGILNTDRLRDLTPPEKPTSSSMVSEGKKTMGGGDNFMAFIEHELMPHMDSRYPTQPYRLFIGHSLGGLMAIHTLIHHPNLFNAYVAIDPSMWWNKRQLLNEAKAVLATHPYTNKALFLGIANTVQELDIDTAQVQKDTTFSSNHLRSILALHHLLKANPQNGLRYAGAYYSDDDHGSVPFITEYDALRFIFKPYTLAIPARIKFSPTFKADSTVVAYYQGLSRQMGYALLPAEMVVNRWGYEYLARGSQFLETAGTLFKRNVVNYPQSANVYDSYGDYFLTKGDTTMAIINFKKALLRQERAEWRQKLTALQAKAGPKPSPSDKTKR